MRVHFHARPCHPWSRQGGLLRKKSGVHVHAHAPHVHLQHLPFALPLLKTGARCRRHGQHGRPLLQSPVAAAHPLQQNPALKKRRPSVVCLAAHPYILLHIDRMNPAAALRGNALRMNIFDLDKHVEFTRTFSACRQTTTPWNFLQRNFLRNPHTCDAELSCLEGSYMNRPGFHLHDRQCPMSRAPGIQRRS